jgi:cold shock CspA family protein/ribosome-associated translation inhibitor RaiA
MQKPLELSFRNVAKSDAIEDLVRQKVDKLERLCSYITSCRVTIDQPQEHQRAGNPYQVLVEVRIPPGHDLVVKREPGESNMHDPLDVIVRDSFDAMERQVKKVVDQQRDDVKKHPEQENMAIVQEVSREEDYGFIRTVDGRSIYFHKNAVVHDDWDRIEAGTGVRFVEKMGADGPQASTVQIVDKPGSREKKSTEPE